MWCSLVMFSLYGICVTQTLFVTKIGYDKSWLFSQTRNINYVTIKSNWTRFYIPKNKGGINQTQWAIVHKDVVLKFTVTFLDSKLHFYQFSCLFSSNPKPAGRFISIIYDRHWQINIWSVKVSHYTLKRISNCRCDLSTSKL